MFPKKRCEIKKKSLEHNEPINVYVFLEWWQGKFFNDLSQKIF